MSMLEKNTCDFSSSRFEFAGQRQKEDMFYSLNWIVSPGLRSQFKIHDVPIVFHLDTQKYHILFFDLSKFDVTTIIERKCMKDQKQKAEFNLYIYIYKFLISWLVMVMIYQYWKLTRIFQETHQFFIRLSQITVMFSHR